MGKVERYIKSVDGTRIFTTSEGEGFPLIFCDGLGCAGFIWRYIWSHYKNQFKLIHFNYRSHGLSDHPEDTSALSVLHYRNDLEAVMDAYDVDKAVILGHSMGVQVILDYALEFNSRVAALIPICGSYGRPMDTFHNSDIGSKVLPYVFKAAQLFPRQTQKFWSFVSKSELVYQVATKMEVNGKIISRDDFKPYFEHLSQMDTEMFLKTVVNLNEHSVEDRLGDVKAPTLIVGGQFDSFTPCWVSERMHQLIPKSELMVIPGGTHVAPIEIPELLELRISQFIKNRVSTRKRRARVKLSA